MKNRNVVALYVDPRGPYPQLVEDWYDEKRDARTYQGDRPVIAHPPCQLWVNFAALNFKRYGGEHNRPGNDGGKFCHALGIVNTYGGVLEHPAFSRAWEHHGLPQPTGIGWERAFRRGWVCEVWQSAYGHQARKRTWLFYSGHAEPAAGNWERKPGTAQCGWFDRIKPTLSKSEASRTPVDFARWLIALAEQAGKSRAA